MRKGTGDAVHHQLLSAREDALSLGGGRTVQPFTAVHHRGRDALPGPQPSNQWSVGSHATATTENLWLLGCLGTTVDLGRCPPGPRAWSWSRSESRRRRRTCGQDALAQFPHRDYSSDAVPGEVRNDLQEGGPLSQGSGGQAARARGLQGSARACVAGSLSCSQETGGQAGLSVCSRHRAPKTASMRSSMSGGPRPTEAAIKAVWRRILLLIKATK